MKTILLVEDDPFLIDIYRVKLKEAGFSVDVIDNGEKVMRSLEEKKPDLILLDLVLPQVDGWEILKKIRESDTLKKISVIVLSNLGQKEDVEKGLKLGADKYLIKAHHTPGEVTKVVKEILEKK